MIVTATEFKTNLGKYLEMAASQDIFITKNGKSIARLTSPAVNKLALLDDLAGIAPQAKAMDEKYYKRAMDQYASIMKMLNDKEKKK